MKGLGWTHSSFLKKPSGEVWWRQVGSVLIHMVYHDCVQPSSYLCHTPWCPTPSSCQCHYSDRCRSPAQRNVTSELVINLSISNLRSFYVAVSVGSYVGPGAALWVAVAPPGTVLLVGDT